MKSVTITANDDGTFQVELEPTETANEAPEQFEGQEQGPQDAAEDQAEGETSQNCASLDEALSVAEQMLGDTGEAKEPTMDGEDQFTQGFKSVRGSPDEQMAARGR
jgi:hypothetical protein